VRGDYLIRSSSRVVDPEPAADTFSVRTRGERGDIECLELARDAVVHDGHDHEVFGLDVALLGFVCNCEGAACHVIILVRHH
jgi:hypothetical protein